MHIERLFTTGSLAPHDKANFVTLAADKEAVSAPRDWNLEAIQAMRETMHSAIPAKRRAIEENTTPSWLWAHRRDGETTTSEQSVLEVVDRIAAAAAYRGWKDDLWDGEISASTFFDEARALLLTRRLVLAPRDMARLGLAWAYGLTPCDTPESGKKLRHGALILQNYTVDSQLSDTHPQAVVKWQPYMKNSQGPPISTVLFADTMNEWGSVPHLDPMPRAMINLMAFRQDDGRVDVVGLGQAAKIATLLLDLHYDAWTTQPSESRAIQIGLGNLASLLMSLGIPYDSEKARGTAAALTAIVTATATITSAQMAAKYGACACFHKDRETCLRVLRNKTRAVFGEKTDYDRLSIVPQTLDVASGADLVLISTARYMSDEALRHVERSGLRHTHLTGFYADPSLAPLMDSTAQGIEPETTLTCDYATSLEDDPSFERRARPALDLGLVACGLDAADVQAVIDHVVGYRTLIAAPVINHYALKQKGFDDAMLDRVEAALRNADHIRQAFTPWIVGVKACRDKLKIAPKKMKAPSFNLLAHLGFTSEEIARANAFCCGHRTVKGVMELSETLRPVFATRADVGVEAVLRMAGATQGFVSGDVDARLDVPASVPADARATLVLQAWRLGLKSVTMEGAQPHTLTQAMPATHGAVVMKRRTVSLAAAAAKNEAKRSKIANLARSIRKTLPKATAHPVSMPRAKAGTRAKTS